MQEGSNNNQPTINQSPQDPVLFGGTGGISRFVPYDLKKMYPVINEMPEFKTLRAREMKFCWLFACLMSPYVEAGLNDIDRAKISAEDAFWTNHNRLIQTMAIEEFDRYVNLEFTHEMRSAIEMMSKFDPYVRYSAQLALESSIQFAIATITHYDPKVIKTTDPKDIKLILQNIKDANEMLPILLKQKESGYGFNLNIGKGGESSKSFEGRMDRNLKLLQENVS